MRRWYVWVTVSVALFGLLIWRTRPWEALSTGADWRLLALVVALNVVVIGAWAVRSERLMAAVGHPLPVTSLVPIVSFANTINNLTPASAGEAVRALILRRRHGVPYGQSTAVGFFVNPDVSPPTQAFSRVVVWKVKTNECRPTYAR